MKKKSMLSDDMYYEGGQVSEKRKPKSYGGGAGASKKRMSYEEGGSLLSDDMPMSMPEETEMVPDEKMEENYVDFVISQTLSEEEQEFLNEQLEGNDKHSVIFDQVIEAASEFTGDGSVEGPGTGVSDDIPARLSDGEFVFTAKAVEEIGADKLEAMMKEAEVEADARQGMAFGGMLQEEEEIEGDMSMVSSDMRKVNPRLNPNLR